MDKKYFGTDGIRGRVGEYPVTPDFLLKLGWAIGRVLSPASGRGLVLIGKDTRISGYMFESALEAGLSAAGADIRLLGPMPTPAVAYLTRTLHASAGIVVSASHNPYYDNGIKFFSREGAKLGDDVELAIEAELDKELQTVESAALGRAERMRDAPGRYIEFCKRTIPSSMDFHGLKFVVDCANGATYHIAPSVFKEMGATVVPLAVEPDGLNINVNCGSTHPLALSKAVLENQADVGIALDGDGDRVIMVDHKGNLVDGDELLYVIARARFKTDKLTGAVVGTAMTNLGLEHSLQALGIDLKRAAVGDRHVMEMMQQGGWKIGGESSGHIICLDRTTTGDGIISALQVLAAMIGEGRSLHELVAPVSKYPQRLINVSVAGRVDLSRHRAIQKIVAQAEARLGKAGRVLLRPSGTEPLVRVMVEGQDPALVDALANDIAAVVENALGNNASQVAV